MDTQYLKIVFSYPEEMEGYMVISDGTCTGLVDMEGNPITHNVVEYRVDGSDFVFPNFL